MRSLSFNWVYVTGAILLVSSQAVNKANCLIKNLLESESLPQIRNLLEMREINPARLRLKSGVENEADDEGTETNCGGDGRSLPQSGQEGERSNSERVCGVDRIRAQLRGARVTQSGAGSAGESQAAGARRRGQEVATAWARTDLRRADGKSISPGVAHHGLH